MRNLLIIFLVVTSTGCINSSEMKISKVINESANLVIENFFNEVRRTGSSTSIKNLLRTNANISLSDSSTTDLIKKFDSINEYSGQYLSHEKMKERFVGDDIGVYTYMVKYEKKFYRFMFMFYNNGVSVRLYKFLFDDNIDIELEESLRFYNN
ncbi:hypothetical protein LQ567_06680 [Niabella pedocola]|uniref:DUF4252 domain-containing protein n=1 Tax=Niabella pedocola TaxID=1752077 RepID=A0ABS8PMW9_9BACT|nr:hypothetical protein [Niabella pedocola]MCD2422441.1 hypothetical protein [Niabella pedocola]